MIQVNVPDPAKKLTNAYKKAKQKGFLRLANFDLEEIPEDLHKFNEISLPGDNWWEDIPLSSIDISNNTITHLDPRLSILREIEVFKMINNKIQEIPRDFLQFENLKILDLSGNFVKEVPREIQNI